MSGTRQARHGAAFGEGASQPSTGTPLIVCLNVRHQIGEGVAWG